MKTTVEIPDALFREAKTYASSRGVSFKEMVETGLRHVLDQGRAQRRPFRLRKHPFKGRGLAPGATWETIREQIYEGRGG